MNLPHESPSSWNPPTIVLMGIGTGVHSLSERYLSWIKAADVIVSGSGILRSLDVNKTAHLIPIKSPLDDVLKEIEDLSKHKKVLIVASGDPLFFGIGRRIIEEFGGKQVLVLPNITYVQYLASRVAVPWNDLLTFSLHGRKINRAFFYWLRNGRKIAVFTDRQNNPAILANMLIEGGFDDLDVIVGEQLGTADELITRAKPREIRRRKWRDPNLVFLMPSLPVEKTGFFEEELFEHDAGMITKREIRSVAISALRLKNEAVLWDIGAGSGSVSIEAAYFGPLSMVCAVEKKKERFDRLRSNIIKFRCGEVVPYCDDILNIMKELPQPDRIFIGGGGKSLSRILDEIKNLASKFTPTVITAVAWESVETIRNFAKENSLSLSVFQICANRSSPIMDSFRFEAINPVFILTLGFQPSN